MGVPEWLFYHISTQLLLSITTRKVFRNSHLLMVSGTILWFYLIYEILSVHLWRKYLQNEKSKITFIIPTEKVFKIKVAFFLWFCAFWVLKSQSRKRTLIQINNIIQKSFKVRWSLIEFHTSHPDFKKLTNEVKIDAPIQNFDVWHQVLTS